MAVFGMATDADGVGYQKVNWIIGSQKSKRIRLETETASNSSELWVGAP
jgi:hypothetical protein